MDILQNVMDASTHAMFTMDRSGRVTHINRQAKERFGLYNHSSQSHGAGRLRKGDLVILATTAMGDDDGNLTAADLGKLNIHDTKLRPGHRLVAVGVFGDDAYKPVYKYIHQGESDTLRLETVYQEVPIKVAIEPGVVSVTVWNNVYSLSYFRSISQMVVLDRPNRRVRFWEENGYSARREGIGSLLRGGSFVAKSPHTEMVVVGYHFRDFFEGELFEHHVQQVLQGQAPRYENQEYEINGFVLTASILPIGGDEPQPEGVIVKFRSIADIRTTILERNAAIQSAERQYRRADGLPETEDAATLFGRSTTMAAARQYAQKLAQRGCDILITGERGTGKTELAKSLTRYRSGPFLTADCAMLEGEDLNVLLFGDSATGHQGLFARCQGGTILLEEIGALPLPVQLKVLGVLQDRQFYPAHSDTPADCDVRIITTSSQDLQQLVDAGAFRSGLYYRLSAFHVELPPLRSCRRDLPLMINALMNRICLQYNAPEKYLSGEAFSLLLSYHWPGNIRELENVLERAVFLSETDIIYPEHIQQDVPAQPLSLRQQLKDTERRILEQTLLQCGGDKQKAMQLLDVSRSVFYQKLKEYHLT